MIFDVPHLWLFTLAAVALLGSPGPGIAALVAVGRREGLLRGLRFYGGLQVGLALAAAVSAAGLAGIIAASPMLKTAAAVLSALYLLYLAWQIATSPVGGEAKASGASSTPIGGFLLGITNPKAYIAFVSLIASPVIVRTGGAPDAIAKWALIVAVIIVVDIAWLGFGVLLNRARLQPNAERVLNVVLALMIVGATLGAWLAG